ncbi:MAG UNVERIFIED_CONTAM: hypothetical protein LVT10_03855 [Anaerolineae bacterium]|jgi:hypothetical protein
MKVTPIATLPHVEGHPVTAFFLISWHLRVFRPSVGRILVWYSEQVRLVEVPVVEDTMRYLSLKFYPRT